jgi:hypothetical protein
MKFLLILAIIIIILKLYLIYNSFKGDHYVEKDQIIKGLIRQAARWSTAAIQDQNPMIAVLHANYGAGYLWALRDSFSDFDIETYGKIDVIRFRDEITKVQDNATRRMAAICPDYAPPRSYLTSLGGE